MAVILIVFLTIHGGRAAAQSSKPGRDLTTATIEDLMNITITSVSRKEQRMGDVPAAVFVLTSEDIRRSGMTTVPELLRLVPGVQVAQINANKWAIAVRGFNNLFGDKLLVLIDGRTVYDRLNSGMFWESLDIPLDQIERIEVTRGPGGATWGANAVNGVISVVTKHAADTAGAAVSVGAGTFDGGQVSARYGGAWDHLAYRLSSQFAGHGASLPGAAGSTDDSWQSQTHRARLDWSRSADTVMVTGDATLATLRGLFHAPTGPVPAVKPVFDDRTFTSEYDILGRWSRKLQNGSTLEVQSFVNYRHNDDPVNPRQTQADVDAQYHTARSRHDLIIGGGYKFLHERVDGGFALSISPSRVTEGVFNLFVQDDIAVGQRLHVMLGAKIERNGDYGTSFQPTARVMFAVVPRHHQVWTGVSRAVRRPSLNDLSARFNYASFVGAGGLPVVIGALGNPDFKSEEVVNVEAGYRFEAWSFASLDVTAFQGRYDNLKTNEPVAPYVELTPAPRHLFIPVQFGNLLKATTSGVEISAHLTPVGWWRFDLGYSTFHLASRLSPASRDVAAASFDGNVPPSQWQARSALTFPAGVQVDAMLFHAAPMRILGIPAYTRADVRLQASVSSRFTVSIVGQNLFSPQHAEFAGTGAVVTPTRIPRSARVQLAWQSKK